MEEKNQQEQPLKKNKVDQKKMTDVASHVVGGVGIGVASYAYGASRTSKGDIPDDPVVHEGEIIEQTIPEEEPVADVIVQEEENAGTSDEEVVVEPEPIVHTDGIDFELHTDEIPVEEEIVEVTPVTHSEENVDIVLVDIPEPELEEPEFPENEFFAECDNGNIAEDIITGDIGSDIQQDLFG